MGYLFTVNDKLMGSLIMHNVIFLWSLFALNVVLLEVFIPAEFHFGGDFMHAK